MTDVSALAQKMIEAVRGFVAHAEAAINKRIDELDAKLKEIPAGAKGDKGDQGESIRGDKGEPGEPGESVKGDKGDAGERGLAGESIKGESGIDGAGGKDGKDGVNGKDVDLDAVSELISIEVTETVGKLPKAKDGADGARGEPGATGKNADAEMVRLGVAEMLPGMIEKAQAMLAERMEKAIAEIPAGVPGKDGASIHPDTVALMVREAVEKAVAAIPRAKDGQPGRDAAELVLLPGIDESRSYPVGAWASHDGGLIRAARATDPVTEGLVKAGWVVMVEGLACPPIITQGEDPREITVAAMLTSGTKAASVFHVPMIIDKGVWREGEYEKGDAVSWDGSGWISQRKTSEKPGTSDAWRLSTKRGRDGKDGKSFDTPAHVTPVVRVK